MFRLRLEGKIALVTGAGSGLGRATALMFAEEGAKVVVADFNEANGAATAQSIIDNGGDALFVKCNVRIQEDIKALVKVAKEKYGRIDVLFNSAGVLVHKPFLEQTLDDFNFIIETNLRGYIWTMQEVLPIMVENGKGSVINVASISAYKPELNAYFYGSAKAGVAKLNMDVAKEFSPKGIRINGICPGPISTNMTPEAVRNNQEEQNKVKALLPVGRLGEPEDIAYLAVYLASDESSFMTGSNIVIDGGIFIS
ncbi:SDR family oxidoreductase [Dehalobacter sp. DCM]|uniref:SDR family NAD(P)-dependent oxidoreductase n=1 Tax=Dehalobacter sp. DCM TaxID=2907827 RepID=UPI0030812338|nr:SDR family oxidoreductase [Dehalobacter sp. DCM]